MPTLDLTTEERRALASLSRSRAASAADVKRARLIMMLDEGLSWSTIGARLLVKGSATVTGGDLTIEARLFDVVERRQLGGKRYQGSPRDARRMANRFADEILLLLTGEAGPFDSRVAFVSTRGGRFKELYVMSFDGSELRQLTRNQTIFLTASTAVLSMEFLFARHLFCRYACAVGLFQSLAWMGNRNAMVVGFQRKRSADCATCLPDRQSACDAVCPMRLTPRNIKRLMFTCTQCAQCVEACEQSQLDNPQGPLLQWVSHEAARQNEAGFRSGKER